VLIKGMLIKAILDLNLDLRPDPILVLNNIIYKIVNK
jgi:hypothetical protein